MNQQLWEFVAETGDRKIRFVVIACQAVDAWAQACLAGNRTGASLDRLALVGKRSLPIEMAQYLQQQGVR